MIPGLRKRVAWFPQLDYQVWILSLGRLLSQMGSGFTLFYAPIFFVNQVGLSATQVGLGLGSASISGVVGRFWGGSWSDSPQWGRKRVILLAAVVSAIASFVLALATDYSMFVLGNLLMGLGIGLYWPPMEALVADLTPPEQRTEAYAISRLCDSLGLGLGVVLGGMLIRLSGAYRALFTIDGISFLVLFAVVYWAIANTRPPDSQHGPVSGWLLALGDRRLLMFAIANILFTLYLVQVSSTIPLYFTNFLHVAHGITVEGAPPSEIILTGGMTARTTGAAVTDSGVMAAASHGFSPMILSALFTWHLAASVILQVPAARLLRRYDHTVGLILSAGFWALGFGTVWLTGVASGGQLAWAVVAMLILALGTVTYMPTASAIVIDLAPESLRGVYLAINSQCWAIGYLIGPPLGGWALDHSKSTADGFWLGLAASVVGAIGVLLRLRQMMAHPAISRHP
jgi:MFS family permease